LGLVVFNPFLREREGVFFLADRNLIDPLLPAFYSPRMAKKPSAT
jgi:hypothetical protein